MLRNLIDPAKHQQMRTVLQDCLELHQTIACQALQHKAEIGTLLHMQLRLALQMSEDLISDLMVMQTRGDLAGAIRKAAAMHRALAHAIVGRA